MMILRRAVHSEPFGLSVRPARPGSNSRRAGELVEGQRPAQDGLCRRMNGLLRVSGIFVLIGTLLCPLSAAEPTVNFTFRKKVAQFKPGSGTYLTPVPDPGPTETAPAESEPPVRSSTSSPARQEESLPGRTERVAEDATSVRVEPVETRTEPDIRVNQPVVNFTHRQKITLPEPVPTGLPPAPIPQTGSEPPPESAAVHSSPPQIDSGPADDLVAGTSSERTAEDAEIPVKPIDSTVVSTESISVRAEPFGSAAHPELVEGERPAQGRPVEAPTVPPPTPLPATSLPESITELVPLKETVWLDEDLPVGAVPEGKWVWESSNAASGTRSHGHPAAEGFQAHSVTFGTPLLVQSTDSITQQVWLDPQNPPKGIALQFKWADGQEGGVYWEGEQEVFNPADYEDLWYYGMLPELGRWTTLEILAEDLGLENVQIVSLRFVTLGGRVLWDKTAVKAAPPLEEKTTPVVSSDRVFDPTS